MDEDFDPLQWRLQQPFDDDLNMVEYMAQRLPVYLPGGAMETDVVFSNEGHENYHDRYLMLANTPSGNYVAPSINDGHEFAIGGEKEQILSSLCLQFAARPQQHWHIIAIPEDNLRLLHVSRRSYTDVPATNDAANQDAYNYTQAHPGFDGGQPQQNFNHGGSMMNVGQVNLPSQVYGNHNSNYQAPHPQMGQTPRVTIEQQRQWHRDFIQYQRGQREAEKAEKKRQKEEDENALEADTRWGDYSGTNLCRWCGPRGHEAIQCIKWDPVYFDKAVCITCNNNKHAIDECVVFARLSEEEKKKLLLEDGANKPGVRSFFYPWTDYLNLDPDAPDAAVPMTRAFIKRLESTFGGTMYTNLWKSYPYGDRELPDKFRTKGFDPEGQDERFEDYWPLITREDDADLFSMEQEEVQTRTD